MLGGFILKFLGIVVPVFSENGYNTAQVLLDLQPDGISAYLLSTSNCSDWLR